MRKRWCQWRTMGRRLRMFHWALQVWFHQFEKVPNFVVGQALSCLTLQVTNFFMQYMFTLICIAASACFHYPLNCDMDYRIFNMPT